MAGAGAVQAAIDDAVLTERIRTIHAESDETYGMPRVVPSCSIRARAISRKRVARLMRHAAPSAASADGAASS